MPSRRPEEKTRRQFSQPRARLRRPLHANGAPLTSVGDLSWERAHGCGDCPGSTHRPQEGTRLARRGAEDVVEEPRAHAAVSLLSLSWGRQMGPFGVLLIDVGTGMTPGSVF